MGGELFLGAVERWGLVWSDSLCLGRRFGVYRARSCSMDVLVDRLLANICIILIYSFRGFLER